MFLYWIEICIENSSRFIVNKFSVLRKYGRLFGLKDLKLRKVKKYDMINDGKIIYFLEKENE